MQNFSKTLLTALLVFCSAIIFAQDKAAEVKALVQAGVKLHDEGKFDEAIAKYQEALKIDPNSGTAIFEIAYSNYQNGKPDVAIPFLEKLIKIDPTSAEAFDMLGNIYDDRKVYDKALDYYKQGLKADPDYQRLHFNLSIFYQRQKLYPEAEQAAIKAIKLNPGHASSHRAYALAAFNLNKRAASLLAWCSFLLLEPQSGRSAEACNYVKYLVNFGIKHDGKGNTNTTVSPNSNDLMFSIAVIGATSGKKDLSSVDSLSLQLASLFKIQDTPKDITEPSFYSKFFVDYFKNMANTDNVAAFTHFITLSTNKDEDAEWFKAHDAELKKFDNWYGSTKRVYE